MLNRVELMGRLTQQPELKHTPSGTAVCTITLAVQRDHKDANGNSVTDFIDCVCWQELARFVSKYFNKGQLAAVTGSLESRKWTDKSGNNRVSFEIRTDKIYFCESKPSDIPAQPYNGADQSYDGFKGIDDDDDVPF